MDVGFIVSVTLLNGTGKIVSIEVFPDTTVGQLKAELEDQEGISLEQYHIVLDGPGTEPLEEDSTMADCKVKEGSKLLAMHMIMFMKVKKPVIYLLPPTPISNARVQISLVKAWKISALYPPTDIGADKSLGLGRSVTWTVDAKPDGTLFHHGSRREVTYLYWEAE